MHVESINLGQKYSESCALEDTNYSGSDLIQTSENIDPYLDTRENITSCSCSSTTMPKAAKTSQTLTVAQVKKMTVVHRLKIKGEDQQEVIVPGDWYVLSWQFTPSVVLTWYQPFSCPCRH